MPLRDAELRSRDHTGELKGGQTMPKYKVIADTSWGDVEYHEITVEADNRSKAMYEAAKIFGYGGKQFGLFLTVFGANVELAEDDTECPCYKIWTSESREIKPQLAFKGTPKYNEPYEGWRRWAFDEGYCPNCGTKMDGGTNDESIA